MQKITNNGPGKLFLGRERPDKTTELIATLEPGESVEIEEGSVTSAASPWSDEWAANQPTRTDASTLETK